VAAPPDTRKYLEEKMKKLLLPILAALLLAQPAAAQPFRLILTHLEPPVVPNSVMDLAVEKGYFEAEGVDVELVRVEQTPLALQALAAGEGEMANVSVDGLLLLVAQGATDLKAVTSPNKSLPYVIVAREDIASVADLAGKRFAVGRVGSLDHSLSMKVLAAEGLDVDSMEILAVGQPNVRAQALVAGQADATTMSIGAWMSVPDKTGYHILIDQDQYYAQAPVVNKVNAVTQQVLDERGEEVEAVIRALINISRDYAADPNAWAADMVPYAPNTDEAGLQELAQSFSASWSVNGGMNRQELQDTQDYLHSTEDFTSVTPVTLEQWVDFGPVDRVLEEVGTVDGDAAGR
jgi:NitT/TauT family transport system substrate-binding protein